MKKLLSGVLFLLIVSFTFPAEASNCKEPQGFVQNITDDVIKILESSTDNNQKKSRLNKMFLELVDADWMARFVLGRHWKTISNQQQSEYSRAYKEYLTSQYVNRFTEYTGKEKITTTGSTALSGKDSHFVTTLISSPGEEDITVGFRVRKVGSCYKVNDIVAEGISLINTQRQDFNSYLNKNGFDKFIELLKTKTAENKNGARKS